VGAGAIGARYRGCLQGRERPTAVVENGGVAAWRTALGRLSSLRQSRSERIRDHLSVCWHCRASALIARLPPGPSPPACTSASLLREKLSTKRRMADDRLPCRRSESIAPTSSDRVVFRP